MKKLFANVVEVEENLGEALEEHGLDLDQGKTQFLEKYILCTYFGSNLTRVCVTEFVVYSALLYKRGD